MRRRALGALAVLCLTVAPACSGDDGGTSTSTSAGPRPSAPGGQPLRLAAMPDAVAAVEAELGGAQRYFEVNATPTLVNLFVAGENAEGTTATAYVYDAVKGELVGQPTDPQAASGNTFTWSAVDFDPSVVLDQALAELPTALPRTFAVTAAGESALQYVITLESSQGGVLDVLVGRDGTVIGAAPRDSEGGVTSDPAASPGSDPATIEPTTTSATGAG